MKGRIRIEGTGPMSHSHKVFLNDIEISESVRSVSMEITAGGFDTTTIVFFGHLELTEEIESLIELSQEENEAQK